MLFFCPFFSAMILSVSKTESFRVLLFMQCIRLIFSVLSEWLCPRWIFFSSSNISFHFWLMRIQCAHKSSIVHVMALFQCDKYANRNLFTFSATFFMILVFFLVFLPCELSFAWRAQQHTNKQCGKKSLCWVFYALDKNNFGFYEIEKQQQQQKHLN